MPLQNAEFIEFANEFSDKPNEFNEDVLLPLARFINVQFGRAATQEHMQDAGATFTENKPPRPIGETGPLRKVSGRLARAVQGTFSDIGGEQRRESATIIQPKIQGVLWSKIITVPYAAIHEYGGKIPTTERMTAFFWAKAYETSNTDIIPFDNHWRRLALASIKWPSFVIPPRPYAKPALESIAPDVTDKGQQLISDFLSDE